MEAKEQINQLISKKEALQKNIQRIQGRLDSARADLESIEAELKQRKVDPANLDAVIQQLETRFETEMQMLQKQTAEAEAQITPYLEEQRV